MVEGGLFSRDWPLGLHPLRLSLEGRDLGSFVSPKKPHPSPWEVQRDG